MASRHQETGSSVGGGTGVRWSLPPVPVVLRIPRIIEEVESRQGIPSSKAPRRRGEFRWPVGVGVAVLMLVAGIPWLIRWHRPADDSLEAMAPVLARESESDSEVLPPLYAQTASNSPALDLQPEGGNDGGIQLLESLTAPHPTGGPQ
jgi:hypothetical protein